MYNYDDIEKIKANLEWIVHQASYAPHVLTRHDQKVIFKLLELIQTYEVLLELIGQYGTAVIDPEVAEGLSATEKFIIKIKRNTGSM
ncbi:hypothetical protein [Enterobacter sp. RD4-1-1]|uniref:hypothetical protein n=1 Tax=Enterobacter sp. RD4-1-1 TaxID=2986135 RepID=UPI0021E849D1|nr:hypothetical protein [Enterobacter sp. RD4-1-1]MCV3773693.1 hypothetical protein [Enterobacter sp. RD4-1-1]